MFESNNAGVMASPFMLSQDNIELQFATNHLGMLLRSFFDMSKGCNNLLHGQQC
jgi:NAD(P)-dependent dehydrogenase (short-subunit alcohol dehydrogenase family)